VNTLLVDGLKVWRVDMQLEDGNVCQRRLRRSILVGSVRQGRRAARHDTGVIKTNREVNGRAASGAWRSRGSTKSMNVQNRCNTICTHITSEKEEESPQGSQHLGVRGQIWRPFLPLPHTAVVPPEVRHKLADGELCTREVTSASRTREVSYQFSPLIR
jgi:hypothetical protein